jgi:hypothetical protein
MAMRERYSRFEPMARDPYDTRAGRLYESMFRDQDRECESSAG